MVKSRTWLLDALTRRIYASAPPGELLAFVMRHARGVRPLLDRLVRAERRRQGEVSESDLADMFAPKVAPNALLSPREWRAAFARAYRATPSAVAERRSDELLERSARSTATWRAGRAQVIADHRHGVYAAYSDDELTCTPPLDAEAVLVILGAL